MLLLQFINIHKEPAKISGGTISLGHDKSNDIVIDEPGVSDFHAEISIDANGITLSDLLSEYGTFVNGTRISRNKPLSPWDRIKLASVEIEISESEKYRPGDWALKKGSDLLTSQYIPLQHSMTVGRNPDCDLVILDGLLSRQHAVLTIEDNQLKVEDLQSSNGTFINQQRIEVSYASPGDEITFDKISFELLGPAPDKTAIELEENTTIRDEQDEDITQLGTIDDATSLLSSPDDSQTKLMSFSTDSTEEKTQLFNPDIGNEKTIVQPPSQAAASPHSKGNANQQPEKNNQGWQWAGIGFLLSVLTGLVVYYLIK